MDEQQHEDQEVLIAKALLLGYEFRNLPSFGWAVHSSEDVWLSYDDSNRRLTWYWEELHEAARAALKHAGVYDAAEPSGYTGPHCGAV